MRRLLIAAVFIVLASQAVFASTNVEGVTGILKTPTAEVVQEGRAEFTLARHLSSLIQFEGGTVARVYAVTVGYLPGLEITARINEFPNEPDYANDVANLLDRSVSVKYQLLNDEDWSLAVGAHDLAGESKIQASYYGVATYRPADSVELSAGVGSDNMEGGFGSLKWSPSDYISLLGEYDTENINYGVELRPLKGVSVKGGIANEHAAFAASYSVPLDPRGQDTLCCPVDISRCAVEYADQCELSTAVRDALVCESFENVLVGSDGETLYVEYEARRFREQIDGLAVAAVVATTTSPAYITNLVLVPKIEDVPQLAFRANMDDLLAFLSEPGCAPDRLHASRYYAGGYPAGTVFAPEGNKKPGGVDLFARITAGFVVNEVSQPLFRTKAGLGLEENIYLGRGTTIKARQDFPVYNEINEKPDPVNRSAILTYHDSWAPGLFGYGAGGYLGEGKYGGKGELGYYFEPGRYKVSGHYGYTRDESAGETDTEDGLLLGELAYYEQGMDWNISLMGGHFMEGDEGIRVESTRYFGPTELTFFAYDTDLSEPHGGFRLFAPLFWFNEGRHSSFRATGHPYFGYQYRTDVDLYGDLPLPGEGLDLARQRLRPEYIENNLANMRRAVRLFYGACPACSN